MTLSSLVVARRVGSIAKVDEALARQVVDGGDLGTCLLEVGAVLEEALVPLLGEAYGIEAVAPGELPKASPEVLRLVPRAVALRYGIYPIEERAGELGVIVSEPLQPEVAEDLGFALGVQVHQYVAASFRIRQAIARDYEVTLEPRLARLIDKLDRSSVRGAGSPPLRSRSGTLRMGDLVPTESPPLVRAPVTAPVVAQQGVLTVPGKRNTWPGMLAFAQGEDDGSDPPPPTPAPDRAAAPTPPSAPRTWPRVPEPPPANFVMEAAMMTAAHVERKRRRRDQQPSGKALVGWARRALGNSIPADRARERKRGPLTPVAAEGDLEESITAEDALAVFFAFAKQYFEYSAMFLVHGDLAEGNDAWGPGSSRERVRGIGVALDLPSTLSDARDRASPCIVVLRRAGLDADLRKDLGRPAPQAVLVLPVLLRGRCIALLYGDAGDEPVSFAEIGDVLAMAPLLVSSLERILLRKKRASNKDAPSAPSSPPAPFPLTIKGGSWADEEQVDDDGWSLPSDVDPLRSQPTPRAVPVSSKPPQSVRASFAPTPPPPQVAVVRPISRVPIAREDVEADDSMPELIMGPTSDDDDDESIRSLLDHSEEEWPPLASRAEPDPEHLGRMSASPRPPPQSRKPLRELPSVLIRFELVDQVIAGGERGEKALGEILELGEAAIPSVLARFPGPLTVDRKQALGDLPRPADCGPVLRIVAAMRRLALPFLAVRSADSDVEVRFWATYLLGELNYADSAQALFPRLFDESTAVRRIALRSARALLAAGEEAASLRKNLERMVTYPDDPEARRMIAIASIAELKIHRSIAALISALSDPLDSISDASARALSAMTRQDFGKDPRKWADWWESKGRKRLL